MMICGEYGNYLSDERVIGCESGCGFAFELEREAVDQGEEDLNELRALLLWHFASCYAGFEHPRLDH